MGKKHTCGIDGDPVAVAPSDGKCEACAVNELATPPVAADEPTDEECLEWIGNQSDSFRRGIGDVVLTNMNNPGGFDYGTRDRAAAMFIEVRNQMKEKGWKRPVNPVVKYPSGEVCKLPGGYRLYVKNNEGGGRTYYTDEIGDGVVVYDTCLHSRAAMLAALFYEDFADAEDARKKREKQ